LEICLQAIKVIEELKIIVKNQDHLAQGLELAIGEVLTAVLHLIVKESFCLGLEGLICHDLCERFSLAVLQAW
jgi:hypothetical protein